MGLIKSNAEQNRKLRAENEQLKNRVGTQKEMLEFLGVLNDVDVEELFNGEGEPTNGE